MPTNLLTIDEAMRERSLAGIAHPKPCLLADPVGPFFSAPLPRHDEIGIPRAAFNAEGAPNQ